MYRILRKHYINTEDYVEKLKNKCFTSDTEINHVHADDILCEILNELGLNEIVQKYEEVGKWYS